VLQCENCAENEVFTVFSSY